MILTAMSFCWLVQFVQELLHSWKMLGNRPFEKVQECCVVYGLGIDELDIEVISKC
jgi:hypothetical protein